MKYIKLYESNYNLWDYVIVNEKTSNPIRDNFVNSNIGQIINPDYDILEQWTKPFDYYVRFDSIPNIPGEFITGPLRKIDGFYNSIRPYSKDEIIFGNPDKEVVESYLSAKKYNL